LFGLNPTRQLRVAMMKHFIVSKQGFTITFASPAQDSDFIMI
jgi:hypothetical protein